MGERGNNLYRKLDRYCGIPLAFISSVLRKPCKESFNPQKAERIGILCLGAIGDLLLVSALVNGLATKLPNASIEIISSRANACALELLGNNVLKSAFSVKNPGTLINYVRSKNYDLFIDTTQWARLGALVANLSGAKCTVGFNTQGQYRSFAYDIKVVHRNDRHELTNFLSLGKAVFDNFVAKPQLVLPSNFNNPFADSRAIYLHMWPARGRGCYLKKWPEEYWAKLAKKLLTKGYDLYLTGSEDDMPGNETFLRKFFSGERKITSIAGAFSLSSLACLLHDAKALVSVNTGIMHLGAILGTPTIGLHGATNPLRWGPIGPRSISLVPKQGEYGYLNLGFEYPQNVESAMQWLPIEDVIKALEHFGIAS